MSLYFSQQKYKSFEFIFTYFNLIFQYQMFLFKTVLAFIFPQLKKHLPYFLYLAFFNETYAVIELNYMSIYFQYMN